MASGIDQQRWAAWGCAARRRRRHLDHGGRRHGRARPRWRRWPICLAAARARRGRARRRIPHRRAATGPDRRGLATRAAAPTTPAAAQPRVPSSSVDRRLTALAAPRAPGSAARAPGAARRPVRPGHRRRGRLPAAPAHRRAAPGRARRRDGRRRGHGGRRARSTSCAGPPCSAATSAAPPRVALPGGRGRPRRRAACACCRPMQPMLAATARRRGRGARRTPGRRRWSGSSTARASRCTATATTCASSPATSTTSPTGCPASWPWRARFPADAVRARRRGARRCDDDAGPAPFQDTMSRVRPRRRRRARRRAARVLLRRAARRRRRPARRPAAGAPAPRSTRSPGRSRVPAHRHRRRRPRPRRSLDDALAPGHEGVMVKALDVALRRRPAGQGRGAR